MELNILSTHWQYEIPETMPCLPCLASDPSREDFVLAFFDYTALTDWINSIINLSLYSNSLLIQNFQH